MENTYVIAWKSKTEPPWGQGKKLFTREEAETLAAELNQSYPAFAHEPLNLAPAPAQPAPEPTIIDVNFLAPAESPEADLEPVAV